MNHIEVIEHGIIYENHLPQLRSRHGYFPNMILLEDRTIAAVFSIGEAFESIDLASYITRSINEGITWEKPECLSYKCKDERNSTDFLKITNAGKRKLLAFGYRFYRNDPDFPIGNPETGGLLDSRIIFMQSEDSGKTWSNAKILNTSFNEPVEASAPITILKDGTWVSPIANFLNWEGKCTTGLHGRLIRSNDHGINWEDSTITMEFADRNVAIWEQRLCELENGDLIVIAWNENLSSGESLPNHYAISKNHGKSFSKPKSTGIIGQASFVMHMGDNKILSLHCMRRNTDRPGIYAYIVDLKNGIWNILYEKIVWEPQIPIKKDNYMTEVFSVLKFGQPSAIALDEQNYMLTNWVVEDGISKIAWHKVKIVI